MHGGVPKFILVVGAQEQVAVLGLTQPGCVLKHRHLCRRRRFPDAALAVA